jgi:hypothetical protein
MGQPLEFKDWVVLGHVLGISIAMTLLMFKHPETSTFIAPCVCTLIGFAVHSVFRDPADAKEDGTKPC